MNRIRECRRKMGLTQVELSKALNISQGTLSGYETGRFEPDVDTMQRLADFFHESLDSLFGIHKSQDICLRVRNFTRFCVNNGTTIYYYICAWRFAVLPGV